MKIAGQISNVVTTPGTLTLDFRLGSVVAFNGGAMQLSTTAHTTVPFIAEFLLTARAVGGGTSVTQLVSGAPTAAAAAGSSSALRCREGIAVERNRMGKVDEGGVVYGA